MIYCKKEGIHRQLDSMPRKSGRKDNFRDKGQAVSTIPPPASDCASGVTPCASPTLELNQGSCAGLRSGACSFCWRSPFLHRSRPSQYYSQLYELYQYTDISNHFSLSSYLNFNSNFKELRRLLASLRVGSLNVSGCNYFLSFVGGWDHYFSYV